MPDDEKVLLTYEELEYMAKRYYMIKLEYFFLEKALSIFKTLKLDGSEENE